VVEVDDRQQSSVPGVFVAGEACGVGGAALAVVEGSIAGAAAAARPLVRRTTRRRDALRAFAAAMHRAHPVPDGWPEWLEDQTVLCRCEEVSVGRLRREAATAGRLDAHTAKLLARPGMGWCQGRVCGYATACLAARWGGTTYDPSRLTRRPLATPITLGTLASTCSSEDPPA
jgi:hypothetical protein